MASPLKSARAGVDCSFIKNIHINTFGDRLMVGSWIGNDQQSGFFEGPLDLIGEGAWRVSASDGRSASRGCELQDSALSVRARRYHAHVSCGRGWKGMGKRRKEGETRGGGEDRRGRREEGGGKRKGRMQVEGRRRIGARIMRRVEGGKQRIGEWKE